jgi:hypothetical protein
VAGADGDVTFAPASAAGFEVAGAGGAWGVGRVDAFGGEPAFAAPTAEGAMIVEHP